jgi:hypothetical protein
MIERRRPSDSQTLPAPADPDSAEPSPVLVQRDVARTLAETLSPPPPAIAADAEEHTPPPASVPGAGPVATAFPVTLVPPSSVDEARTDTAPPLSCEVGEETTRAKSA